MNDTPRTDMMVSGNSPPGPDEYEDLAQWARQLERECDGHRALVVKKNEALQQMLSRNLVRIREVLVKANLTVHAVLDGSEFLLKDALALMPADLTDCAVIKRELAEGMIKEAEELQEQAVKVPRLESTISYLERELKTMKEQRDERQIKIERVFKILAAGKDLPQDTTLENLAQEVMAEF